MSALSLPASVSMRQPMYIGRRASQRTREESRYAASSVAPVRQLPSSSGRATIADYLSTTVYSSGLLQPRDQFVRIRDKLPSLLTSMSIHARTQSPLARSEKVNRSCRRTSRDKLFAESRSSRSTLENVIGLAVRIVSSSRNRWSCSTQR